MIADLEDILANEARQRQIVSDELAEIVEKFGNERRTPDHRRRRRPVDGGPDPRRGPRRLDHPRRLRQAHPRRPSTAPRSAAARACAARRCAATTWSSTSSPPPTTTGCCSSPRPAGSTAPRPTTCPRPSRDAKGGHVAGLLSFQPDEDIAQVLAIRDYEQAPYLVLATRNGLVKKTRLGDYNSPRQAGVIAINFREDDDELIGAELVNADDDILLVSRKGQAIRFRADDDQLRPMGRATSGVTRHEVPRRRRAAVDVGDPGRRRSRPRRRPSSRPSEAVRPTVTAAGGEGAVRLHHHRRRLRQAHPDLRLPHCSPAAASASRR